MKTLYVCSGFAGDVEGNVAFARRVCREVALAGHAPVAPHLFLPDVLDDADVEEREVGLRCGLALLEICDEVLVAGPITDGMESEIEAASAWGIPVRFHSKESTR